MNQEIMFTMFSESICNQCENMFYISDSKAQLCSLCADKNKFSSGSDKDN